MKIVVANKQERILMEQFCDVALKADGMKNLNAVVMILGSIEDEPMKEVKLPDGPDS